METPFVYGKIAVNLNFTNRDKELKKLRENFLAGTNMVLLSPRRWGKSSLVRKAADGFIGKEKKIRFVFIDMFGIRTEEDFYKALLENTLQSVSGGLAPY